MNTNNNDLAYTGVTSNQSNVQDLNYYYDPQIQLQQNQIEQMNKLYNNTNELNSSIQTQDFEETAKQSIHTQQVRSANRSLQSQNNSDQKEPSVDVKNYQSKQNHDHPNNKYKQNNMRQKSSNSNIRIQKTNYSNNQKMENRVSQFQKQQRADNVIREQLNQLMKNQNMKLSKYLDKNDMDQDVDHLPQREKDASRVRSKDKMILIQDESPYMISNSKLLPSDLVDRRNIKTPMQYKLAAKQHHKNTSKKRNDKNPSLRYQRAARTVGARVSSTNSNMRRLPYIKGSGKPASKKAKSFGKKYLSRSVTPPIRKGELNNSHNRRNSSFGPNIVNLQNINPNYTGQFQQGEFSNVSFHNSLLKSQQMNNNKPNQYCENIINPFIQSLPHNSAGPNINVAQASPMPSQGPTQLSHPKIMQKGNPPVYYDTVQHDPQYVYDSFGNTEFAGTALQNAYGSSQTQVMGHYGSVQGAPTQYFGHSRNFQSDPNDQNDALKLGYDFSLVQQDPNMAANHPNARNYYQQVPQSRDPHYESTYQSQQDVGDLNGSEYVNTTQNTISLQDNEAAPTQISQNLLAFMAQTGVEPNLKNFQHMQHLHNLTSNSFYTNQPGYENQNGHQTIQSLSNTVNTSQMMQFPQKLQHMANKYNVEVDPQNQAIFDEKEKMQSSMVTSVISGMTQKTGQPTRKGFSNHRNSRRTQQNDGSAAMAKGRAPVSHTTKRNMKSPGAKSTNRSNVTSNRKLSKKASLQRRYVLGKKRNTAEAVNTRGTRACTKSKSSGGMGSRGSASVTRSIRGFKESSHKVKMISSCQQSSQFNDKNKSKSKPRTGKKGLLTATNSHAHFKKSHTSHMSQSTPKPALSAGHSHSRSKSRSKPTKLVDMRTAKIRSSLTRLAKMQHVEKADTFHRDLTIRKFFCVWIEQFIEALKQKKTRSDTSLSSANPKPLAKSGSYQPAFNPSKMAQKVAPGCRTSQQRSKHSLRQSSNQRSLGEQVQRRNEAALLGRTNHSATEEAVHLYNNSTALNALSQSQCDNAISPSSAMIAHKLQHYQRPDNSSRIFSIRERMMDELGHTGHTGNYQTQKINLIPGPTNVSPHIKLKSRYHTKDRQLLANLESMQNIQGAGNDHQNMDILPMGDQLAFKQTACLGRGLRADSQSPTEMNIFNHQAAQQTLSNSNEMSEIQGNYTKKVKFNRALQILKKFDNRKVGSLLGGESYTRGRCSAGKSRNHLSPGQSRTAKSNTSALSRKGRGHSAYTQHQIYEQGQSQSKSNTISYVRDTNGSKSNKKRPDSSLVRSTVRHTLSRSAGKRNKGRLTTLRSDHNRSFSRSMDRSMMSLSSKKKSGRHNISATKSNVTKYDILRLMVEKSFLIWKKDARHSRRASRLSRSRGHRQSSQQSEAWAYKYHQHVKKRQALYGLQRHRMRVNRLKQMGYNVMRETQGNVISRTFLIWIENFNQRQIGRKKTYYATQHWVQKIMMKYFARIRHQWQMANELKHRSRQVVPMRCLIAFVSDGQNFQEYGQELYYATQTYHMRMVNERQMFNAIEEYKANIKNQVFQRLKQNYHQVCNFKANQAIRTAQVCVQNWRIYASKKRLNRQKVAQFNYDQVIGHYRNILFNWRIHSAQKAAFRRITAEIQRTQAMRIQKDVFESVRDFGFMNNEKSLQKFRARKFNEANIKMRYLKGLKMYLGMRLEKNERYNQMNGYYLENLKANTFKHLHQMLSKLKVLKSAHQIVQQKRQEQSKYEVVQLWHIRSIQFSRARVFNEGVLRRRHFHLLQEAVLISQINVQKKCKAYGFRAKNLKYDLLWFLKEYQYEQEMRRDNHRSAFDEMQLVRKRMILGALIKQVVHQQQMRQLKAELLQNYQKKMKSKAVQALAWNIQWQSRVDQMTSLMELKFKKEWFDYLRYSVKKQQILRYAIIETVQQRNKKRAEHVLHTWQIAAMQKNQTKSSLDERIIRFTVLRTLRKFRQNRMLRIRSKQILTLCLAKYTIALKEKVLGSLIQYHNSDKVVNLRKAYNYRAKQLLAPAFVAFKKQCYMNKMHHELRELQDHRAKQAILRNWIRAVFNRQMQKQTTGYNERRLMKKTLDSLKNRVIYKKDMAAKTEIAFYHRLDQRVILTFNAIRNYKYLRQSLREEEVMKDNAATNHFLGTVFRMWSSTSKSCAILSIKAKHVNKTYKLSQQKKFFGIMLEKHRRGLKHQKACSFADVLHLRKVFKFLKREAKRNIMLKAMLSNKNVEQVAKTKVDVFKLLKQNRIHSQQQRVFSIKALQQWCLYIQKKAFVVLQENRIKKKRLNALYEAVESRHAQKVKEKYVQEMINHYIVSRKLDDIGEKYFKKRQLQLFKKKVLYIRDRNQGTNLHEFEVRAFTALGKNLLRKAFVSIKLHQQANYLKNQEVQMIIEYQQRKWFSKWRENYLIKSQNNYFNPVQNSLPMFPIQQLPPQFQGNVQSEDYNRRSYQNQNPNIMVQQQQSYDEVIDQQMPPIVDQYEEQVVVSKPRRHKSKEARAGRVNPHHKASEVQSMHTASQAGSVAQKVQMLTDKIQTRLASRGHSQNSLSKSKSKERQGSRQPSAVVSGYASSIAKNVVQSPSMQENFEQPQIIKIDSMANMSPHRVADFQMLNDTSSPNKSSIRRSPQKSRGRQKNLQQSASPNKKGRHNDSDQQLDLKKLKPSNSTRQNENAYLSSADMILGDKLQQILNSNRSPIQVNDGGPSSNSFSGGERAASQNRSFKQFLLKNDNLKEKIQSKIVDSQKKYS